MSNCDVKRSPWFKFYTSDWRGDAALRSCGYAAKGLWIDMLSLMHEATPYGHLLLNGRAVDARQLAAMLGGNQSEIARHLCVLEASGVFSRNDQGVIYSRRMQADFAKALKDRENGKSGGNPRIQRNNSPDHSMGVNPTVNQHDNGCHNHDVNDHDNQAVKGYVKAHIPETRYQKESALDQSDFDRFWEAYPRKVAKDAARSAFVKALKRGATVEIIIAALESTRWSPDPKFIPHPPSWLNAGRWQDENSQETANPTDDERRLSVVPKTPNPCRNDPPEAWHHLADSFEIEPRTGIKRAVVNGFYIDVMADIIADPGQLRADVRYDWTPLIAWLRDGIDRDEIIAGVRRVASRSGYTPPGSLMYFDAAVRERRAA